MPLPSPSLDNRRFDQLVSEGRGLLPRGAPALTDHNASDPSSTLLELGAWLSEQNFFRFDRLSEEAMRAFVRLVGIEPHPPGLARAVVSVLGQGGAGLTLPPRVQLGRAGEPLFEGLEQLFASPALLTHVLAGGEVPQDVTMANAAREAFHPFGPRPRRGSALYLGFDRSLVANGEALSLHVWTDAWEKDAATRTALEREHASLLSHQPAHCPQPASWQRHYRVECVWEYHAGGGLWQTMHDVQDETRALTLTGFVRFSAPQVHAPGGPGAGFFIRCRILRGRFECPPRIRHVAFNALAAEHALTQPERDVGLSHGHAGQRFTLGVSPVVMQGVSVRLDDGVGNIQEDWSGAPDLERAGAHDKVFVTDAELGEVRCGDGLRGRIFPAGYRVLARCQVGGGESGNMPAGSLTMIPATAANLALAPSLASLPLLPRLSQPFAAMGGSAREPLAGAQRRAFELVSDMDKAVTLSDIERIALATPGVPVARVRAVANLDARLPCYPAPGCIALIVIPHCPRPKPMPSRALLDAVERYLDPRRLVTSQINAMAPRYRSVAVHATLHLACDALPREVLAAADSRMAKFFDPLDGGPQGTGWPFGRAVYRSEVMALLAATPGVSRVTGVALVTRASAARPVPAMRCGPCGTSGLAGGGLLEHCENVELCEHELVAPGRNRFILEADALNLKRSNAHEC